jgi:hypothetical protein
MKSHLTISWEIMADFNVVPNFFPEFYPRARFNTNKNEDMSHGRVLSFYLCILSFFVEYLLIMLEAKRKKLLVGTTI